MVPFVNSRVIGLSETKTFEKHCLSFTSLTFYSIFIIDNELFTHAFVNVLFGVPGGHTFMFSN